MEQRFEEVEWLTTRKLWPEPFDFTLNESYETDEEKLDYATSNEALKERWRKYLKQRVLSRIEDRNGQPAGKDGK
ncbi:MAG: hypothetical protein U5L96_15300 [Owenweeksia sp.]|nr:hypothetical protein [Owenweeksia sp.]